MTYREAIDKARRDYLCELMFESHGNVSQAARTAQIGRWTLHKLLKRYGITRPEVGCNLGNSAWKSLQ